ncbi:MAG: TIGR02556 family CRISPR-associated protein [Candidatus Thermoplasmatota archaeon]
MMKAISELGEYLIHKERKKPLSILVENPETKYVLSVVLRKRSDDYKYEKVELEEYQERNKDRYLYRRGASQGANVTPSSIVTDLKKTYNKKFLYWFSENNLGTLGISNTEEFIKIKNALEKNQLKILNDIKKSLSDLDSKEQKQGILLTIKFNENGGKYIGDFEIFKTALIHRSTLNYYLKYGCTSLGKETICSLCFKTAMEVYGFTSDIFPFYTLDKPGFAPQFNQENAWKLYPVCPECALKLEAGRRYIEDKLNLNFYGGLKYYLIPKFLFSTDYQTYDKILDQFEAYAIDPSFSTHKTGWVGDLTNKEDRILEIISKEKDIFALDFLFYDRPQKKELKILLHINEILPSRLKKLYEIKKEVDRIELFEKNNLKFNFEIVYNIFVKSQEKKEISQRYYLDTIEKIFVGHNIDYELILDFLVRRIRKNFVNGWSTKDLTLGGLLLFIYTNKLGILYNFGGKKIMKKSPSEILNKNTDNINKIVDKIFVEFSDFFDSNAKKAIFLEGVLAQKLLNIQLEDRGSKPFIKKLNGLKLDEKKVKNLLSAIQGKLEEYDKNYYKKLEKRISEYFISSGKNWDLSNDEISFYFVLGMNLVELFKFEKKEGGVENE